jgi:hypothetical protein
MVLRLGKETFPLCTLQKFQLLSVEVLLFHVSVALVFLNVMCGFAHETGLSAVSESNTRNHHGFGQRQGEILRT